MSDLEWALVEVLSLVNVMVLTVGLLLSIVAVRGFKDAPFGRMLKPLPVMFLAFILVNAPWTAGWLGELPHFWKLYSVVFTVAVVAAMWASAQAIFLLTERREL